MSIVVTIIVPGFGELRVRDVLSVPHRDSVPVLPVADPFNVVILLEKVQLSNAMYEASIHVEFPSGCMYTLVPVLNISQFLNMIDVFVIFPCV